MKLKIENIKVGGAIQVLDKMPLKGLKSIHRTRLSEKLQEELQRVAKEETEIIKEYAKLDDEGQPQITKDGRVTFKDEEGLKEFTKHRKEEVIIDSGDSYVMLKSVKRSLEDCEVEWDGKDAYSFADLYDAIEGNTEDE